MSGLALPLGNATVRIVNIAEYDGVGRTRAGAGGNDFTIVHAAILFLSHDFGVIDPLHAVATFFHDAAAADGDVRIALKLNAFSFPIRKEQEVEAANLV